MRPRLIDRHELAWRARVFARTEAERLAARWRPPRWRREALHDVLARGLLRSAECRAIDVGDWTPVHNALFALLSERRSRFVLDHQAADTLALRIAARWPNAMQDAVNRADRILWGRYDLLAYHDLSFADGDHLTTWHRDPVHDKQAPVAFWANVPYLNPDVVGDHKIIWELNRHQYWLQLGRALWLTRESKYADRIREDLAGWLAANPPLRGINWASMLELGFRSLSWTWGLHFLLRHSVGAELVSAPGRAVQHSGRGKLVPYDTSAWLVDMLVALDRQLRHVEHNLSYYFSPNTHLTGEALALYVVGLALPELAASGKWVERGRTILLEQIDRQILPDGGHAERSAHYHRYTLDIYLFALVTATRANDSEAAARFREVVGRLASFARALADDRGVLPVIGDDDGGMLWPITGRDCRDVRDSLALAAAILERPELAPWGMQEEVCWIGGEAVVRPFEGRASEANSLAPQLPSSTFPDTGYVIMRDSHGDHMVFDVGPHGYLNGGHAHADALAITIETAHGPLLVDPGTSTYTLDRRLRDRMRRSRNHNTLEIDRRPQSIPSGPFHWRTRTDSHLHGHRHNLSFDWAEASHDGYAPAQHRRSVVRSSASGWLVVDDVLAEGRYSAAAFWHFDPAWTVTAEAPGRLRATHRTGAVRWLLHDGATTRLARGDERSGLGWCAPVYGALMPTWSAEVTQDGRAPFTVIAWISGAGGVMPSLERLAATCDPCARAVAARIVDGERASLFLVRAGEPRFREGRATGVAEYQTDARLLHCLSNGGRFVSLDLIDASHALALADGLVSISADGVIGDLHVELVDDVLVLCSSEPPARLTLRGDAIGHVVVNRDDWDRGRRRIESPAHTHAT